MVSSKSPPKASGRDIRGFFGSNSGSGSSQGALPGPSKAVSDLKPVVVILYSGLIRSADYRPIEITKTKETCRTHIQ